MSQSQIDIERAKMGQEEARRQSVTKEALSAEEVENRRLAELQKLSVTVTKQRKAEAAARAWDVKMRKLCGKDFVEMGEMEQESSDDSSSESDSDVEEDQGTSESDSDVEEDKGQLAMTSTEKENGRGLQESSDEEAPMTGAVARKIAVNKSLQLRKNLLTKAKETKTIADIDESSQSTVGADGNDDVDLTLDFIIQEYEKLDLKEKDMEKVKLDVKRCLIALIREVGMLSIHKWIVSMQARQSSVAYKNYYEGDVSSNPEYKAARQQLGSKAGSILSGYIWKYVSTKKRQPVTFAMFYKLLGVKKGGFKKNPVEVFGSDFVNIANQVLRGRNKKIWRKTITLPDLPEFRAHFSCARFEGLNYDHVEIGTEVGEDLEDEADVGSLERVFPDSSRTLKLRLTRVDKEIQTITRSIKTHEMALEEDRKTLFDLVKEKSMLSDKIQEAEESEKLGQVSKDLFGSGVSAAQKIAKLSTFIRTSVRDATSEGRAKARTALIEFLDSEGERQNRKRKCTESGEEELLDIDCPPADMVEPKKNKKLKPSKESSKPSLEPKKPSTSTTAVAPKKKVDRKKLVKKADKKKRVAPKLKAVVETSEKILNDEEKEAEKVSNETAGKEIPSETSEKNGEQKLSKPEVLVVEEHETVGKSGGKPQPATNTEAVVSEVALVAEDVNNVSVESEAGSVSSDPSA